MKSSIIRAIEKKQALLPEEERFDFRAKKRFNATRRKKVTAEDREAAEQYLTTFKSALFRDSWESPATTKK